MIIFGGGDIAEQGIIPVCGGSVVDCDVTDFLDVEAAIKNADVIVNCAGISHPGPLSGEARDEILVNLIGSFIVAEAAPPEATMIFIASVAGLYGKPNHAGYCASKAGVISLVQSLGMEGRNAYAISPGRVNTRMRERDYPGEDVRTRLDPRQIGLVVKDILAGRYDPGDNIIIRKIGYDTFLKVDKGEPWRSYLNVVPL